MTGVDAALAAMVPHRAPILQLRAVVAAGPEHAVTEGRASGGHGSLPWELGAIEGIAQTAAVLHAQSKSSGPAAGMLVGVRDFVFREAPPPGALVRYTAELVRRIGPAALVQGRAECDGRLLAHGELKLWNTEPEVAP